ncbi:cytochrome P450 [Xylariales sp. AK1849]|nr:cytochrome P450 [Xylariales sp. AK1849]
MALIYFVDLGPNSLLSSSIWSNALITLSIAFVISVYLAYAHVGCGGNVPLVNEPSGKKWFSLANRLAYYTDCARLYGNVYKNYSEKDSPVWVPSLGTRNDIIMPNKSLPWVLSQPSNIINIEHAYHDINGLHYSLGSDKYMLDRWQGMLVSKYLNKVLDSIVLSMNDELKFAFDRRFGTDRTQWRELDLNETVRMIVVQAMNRFQIGLPLCRNEQYLKTMANILDDMIMSGATTLAAPAFLRPLVSPFAHWRLRRRIGKVRKQIESLFAERCKALQQGSDDPAYKEPLDFFQMMMKFAYDERPEEFNLHDITNRLCMANFEAIHQTSNIVINILLNIAGSDAEYDTITALRNEAVEHLATGNGSDEALWTKAKISELAKADSVSKETLRLHGFAARGLFRKVMADGVCTENGVELPSGSILSFLSHNLHYDDRIFDDASKFDPWRFHRLRPQKGEDTQGGTHTFVSTAQVLSFGRGRHACPGRFLVDFEVKMIISYLLLNYDIRLPREYDGRRPDNQWVAEACMPPKGVKLSVKRR